MKAPVPIIENGTRQHENHAPVVALDTFETSPASNETASLQFGQADASLAPRSKNTDVRARLNR